MQTTSTVFDTSALIALIQKEEGADIVAKHLKGAIMSSVNFSEVAAVLARKMSREEILPLLTKLIGEIVLFDEVQALEAGLLYQQTKHLGLSLGDRSCISLALSRKLPVLTTDKIWQKLDIGIEVRVIR